MPVRRPPRVGSDGCCFRISGGSVRRRLELVAGGRRPRAYGDSEVEVGPSFFTQRAQAVSWNRKLQARELQGFRDSLQLRKQVRTFYLERVELCPNLAATAEVDANRPRQRRPGKLLRGAFSSAELALCFSQHAQFSPPSKPTTSMCSSPDPAQILKGAPERVLKCAWGYGLVTMYQVGGGMVRRQQLEKTIEEPVKVLC